MSRLYASINDTKQVLWYKIAWNLYNWAIDNGAVGLHPPGIGDEVFQLEKKTAYFAAVAAALP